MYKKRHTNLLSEVNMPRNLYDKYRYSISKSLIVGNLRFPVDTLCHIQRIYELTYMSVFKFIDIIYLHYAIVNKFAIYISIILFFDNILSPLLNK